MADLDALFKICTKIIELPQRRQGFTYLTILRTTVLLPESLKQRVSLVLISMFLESISDGVRLRALLILSPKE